MPTNYTGDPTATQAPSPTPAQFAEPIVVLPNDGEAATAASLAQAWKTLADFCAFLTNKAGIINQTNAWSAINTFTAQITTNGPSSDEEATRGYGGTITTRKLIDNLAGSAANARTYVTNNGEYEIVVNALWHSTGGDANKWTQDNAAVASSRFKWSHAFQAFVWETKASGSAAWLDANWTLQQGIDTNGDSSLTRDFLAGRDVTASRNVAGKRFKSTGTALATGDFTLGGGNVWGNTATVSAATGSDMAGTVTVSSSGTGQTANPTLLLTFKDGTFTTTPTVIWSMKGGTGVAAGPYGVEWTVTATTTTVQMFGTPAAGSTYIFSWMVVGN